MLLAAVWIVSWNCLIWCEFTQCSRLKYFSKWLCADKSFCIDYEVNRTKFLSLKFVTLQKTEGNVSEEI